VEMAVSDTRLRAAYRSRAAADDRSHRGAGRIQSRRGPCLHAPRAEERTIRKLYRHVRALNATCQRPSLYPTEDAGERLMTPQITLDEINEASHRLHEGKAFLQVVTF